MPKVSGENVSSFLDVLTTVVTIILIKVIISII